MKNAAGKPQNLHDSFFLKGFATNFFWLSINRFIRISSNLFSSTLFNYNPTNCMVRNYFISISITVKRRMYYCLNF